MKQINLQPTHRRPIRLLCALCVLGGFTPALQAAVPEKVTYDDHVMPIFREHCLACHDAGARSGDLALDSFNDTLTGGASGEVVEAGAGDSSRLYRLMAHLDKPVMPPGSDKLTDEQLAVVKAWIDGGLLENAGSKAKKSSKPKVEAFVPSADNRPAGEPAMPGGFYREPVIHAPHVGAVADVAASPWAPLIAVTGQRQVLLYHADSRELLAVVPFVVGMPEVVRFSRNGDLLLVAGGQGAKLGVVHLWDIKSGQRITEVGDELDTILAADTSPNHALVAMGGPRKRVQVYRTGDASLAYSLTKHTDWVTALEFSPNGKYLVTADRAAGVHVWEAETGRPVSNLAGHQQAITAVSWRGDSGLIVTASDDGDIRTWQPTGSQVKQWNHGGGVQDAEFTKSGQLVSIGRDKLARLWTSDGKEVRRFGPMGDIGLAIAATHDESQLALADWTGMVQLAKLETGDVVGELSVNPPTLAMRLAAAEQAHAEATSNLPAAQNAVAEATAKLQQAMQAVAEHEAKQKAEAELLAELEKQHRDHRAELDGHRQALEELDRTIAAVRAEQQQAEAAIAKLKQELASVGDQQADEADASAAGQLEMQIADKQSSLEDILAKRGDSESNRPPVVQSRRQARQQLDGLAGRIEKQKATIAALNQSAANLPHVDELKSQRDQSQARLSELEQAKAGAAEKIARLKSEIEVYAAAVATLKRDVEFNDKAAEAKAEKLARANEQLAEELADVATVAREIEDLERRIADLDKLREKLAAVADKSKATAGEIEQQMAELSAAREKIENTLADFAAAAELRKQHATDD